jgi:ABC-type nickel/cobalt efflux system permease component RcnA
MAHIPVAISMVVFIALFALLVQKEVLRALGRSGPGRWELVSNTLIGLLVVVYGLMLISRFVRFVQ